MLTREEWLARLTAKLDSERTRVVRLRSYLTGNGPLPEMGPNLRKSWERFQRRARSNPAKLVVDPLVERIVPNGVTVGDDSDSETQKKARRIYRDNRLGVAIRDAIQDAVSVSVGYILVSEDSEGLALVTRERPEQMYADPDPERPWKARAAVKVWRDTFAGKDHLVMWADGVMSRWQRDSLGKNAQVINRVSGDWVLVPGSEIEYDGSAPVVILGNKDSVGEFEPHLDTCDRINWEILQRLVITAMQAFRQRALKTSKDADLDDEDEDGDDIDYQAIFDPSPGALWELPPGVEIWESQQTDVQGIILGIKESWRELAALTGTPLSIMLPDSANQSAAGAEAPQRQLVSKAKDRIERFKPALAVVMVKALAVEGVELGDETVEVLFEPPHAVSLTEKYAAAAQARAAGESLETVQRNILGYSPEQIAADKQRRSEEALAMAFALKAPDHQSPDEDVTQ